MVGTRSILGIGRSVLEELSSATQQSDHLVTVLIYLVGVTLTSLSLLILGQRDVGHIITHNRISVGHIQCTRGIQLIIQCHRPSDCLIELCLIIALDSRSDHCNQCLDIGITILMILDLVERYNKLGFRYAETNAMLETNSRIHAMFEPFEKEIHKRRWVFGKDIQ